MYSLRLRSCRLMGAFVISPLPPLLNQTRYAARPLGSASITPPLRYYGPSRRRLAFSRFPGCAGYTRCSFAINRSGQKLLCRNTFISVMEAAELWNCDNLSTLQRLPRKRTLLSEAQVGFSIHGRLARKLKCA